MSLKLVITGDHRGVPLKRELVAFLSKKGHKVNDLGPDSDASVDYPDFALKAAEAVASGKADKGIVICHSGIGVSVTANKVTGIRAALCHTPLQAELARKHTDANVLALPAGFVPPAEAKKIVASWLGAAFEGGRHQTRIEKISSYEEKERGGG
jgi:ribose 5-phosphate isomerase B